MKHSVKEISVRLHVHGRCSLSHWLMTSRNDYLSAFRANHNVFLQFCHMVWIGKLSRGFVLIPDTWFSRSEAACINLYLFLPRHLLLVCVSFFFLDSLNIPRIKCFEKHKSKENLTITEIWSTHWTLIRLLDYLFEQNIGLKSLKKCTIRYFYSISIMQLASNDSRFPVCWPCGNVRVIMLSSKCIEESASMRDVHLNERFINRMHYEKGHVRMSFIRFFLPIHISWRIYVRW